MKNTKNQLQHEIDLAEMEIEDLRKKEYHQHPFRVYLVEQTQKSECKVRLATLKRIQKTFIEEYNG
jgi:hypothetical protein